jgi:hypothetical protein
MKMLCSMFLITVHLIFSIAVQQQLLYLVLAQQDLLDWVGRLWSPAAPAVLGSSPAGSVGLGWQIVESSSTCCTWF